MKMRFIPGLISLFLGVVLSSSSKASYLLLNPVEDRPSIITETFTFSSNGTKYKGKIFIPASYETHTNLPAIYLVDFAEQDYKVAKDEFEKVVAGVRQIQGFDALVVTLEEHQDIDAKPQSFLEYYDVFKNMSSYVDSIYTKNTSRTFIGRGSEAGIVLMTLFLENSEVAVFESFIVTDPAPSFTSTVINMIENEDVPKSSTDKKLHFSFSTSNDYDLCATLITLLEKAQYPWLRFETKVYTDSNYENTYPVSFAAGLEYIFME